LQRQRVDVLRAAARQKVDAEQAPYVARIRELLHAKSCAVDELMELLGTAEELCSYVGELALNRGYLHSERDLNAQRDLRDAIMSNANSINVLGAEILHATRHKFDLRKCDALLGAKEALNSSCGAVEPKKKVKRSDFYILDNFGCERGGSY
jgi:hypothetical protein